ncbi:MAG: hypothetical protein ACREKL_14340 [Chthoniobacterales bacterium]
MKNRSAFLHAAALAVALLFPTGAAFATNYDEGTDGDLSDTMGAPTAFALTPGSNVLTATTVSGDEDYVAISVPAGYVLQGIVPSAYSGATKSFIAIQNGATFTVPPTATTAAGLLGWAHFGVTGTTALVGTDILDDMGEGAGAAGFIPPLASGTYAIWLQETGGVAVTYTLVFNTIPTPPPPVVKVSGKKVITTTKARVKFKGRVNGFATRVEFRVGTKGAYKLAEGHTTWSLTAKVKHGRNLVSVRAVGIGGQSKTAKVTVFRK